MSNKVYQLHIKKPRLEYFVVNTYVTKLFLCLQKSLVSDLFLQVLIQKLKFKPTCNSYKKSHASGMISMVYILRSCHPPPPPLIKCVTFTYQQQTPRFTN